LFSPFAVLAQEAAVPTFEQVLPVLERVCWSCHDDDIAKGDVDLYSFRDEAEAMNSYRVWDKAHHLIESYEMPPGEKKQPSEEERRILLGWIESALEKKALENAGDPGKVVIRRLTNAEYDYTVRDLTGIDLRPSRKLPNDGGGGEGFSNTGDVLFLSPELLEKYLDASRDLADRAIIQPGTGIQFRKEPVGVRGKALLVSEAELAGRAWYREKAKDRIPKSNAELKVSEYVIAVWQYAHREITGARDLPQLARESGLDPFFLQNWWRFVSEERPKSRLLAPTWDLIKSMPAPDPSKPGEIPVEVEDAARWADWWRQAWLVEKAPGYTVQRLQQDVDSLNQQWVKTKITKSGWYYLCVTDAGDGNAGDLVHWSGLSLKWKKDGSYIGLFEYLKTHHQWHRGEVSKHPEGSAERKSHLNAVAQLDMLLALPGTHPDGGETKEGGFAVRAPSRIPIWISDDVTEFTGLAQLQLDHHDRDRASVQAFLGPEWTSDPLHGIEPGYNVRWHRGTTAHRQIMDEFSRMKAMFPDTYDKRLETAEAGLYHWDDRLRAIYTLHEKQILEELPVWQRGQPDALRLDYAFPADPSPDKANLKDLDDRLLAHLTAFAYRAWRRPLTESEQQSIRRIYHRSVEELGNREAAGREVVVRVLISPNFLYKGEPPSAEAEPETRLDPHQFAARLSYFLWGSMPDEALSGAARDGRIFETVEIDAQIDRMLKDWRSPVAFGSEFFGQWLGFRDFPTYNSVDQSTFPDFKDGIRWSMYREVLDFTKSIVDQDRAVTDLVLADDSFLDARLAAFYGLPEWQGADGEFQQVSIKEESRGGLLGMGAILVKTSYPARTSPVLRGDWILRNLLGHETPPPPAEVPELDDDGLGADLTLRQRLEKHRESAACAGCHSRIDPPGFALENFDAIGRWRDQDEKGRPIDNVATLRDGSSFKGVNGLRDHFRREQDAYLRQFCTKLLGYALGREILVSDRALLAKMERVLRENEFRFSAAVRTIVHSRQFQNRRNDL